MTVAEIVKETVDKLQSYVAADMSGERPIPATERLEASRLIYNLSDNKEKVWAR